MHKVCLFSSLIVFVIFITKSSNGKTLLTSAIPDDSSKFIEYRNTTDRNCPPTKAWTAIKPKSIVYSIIPLKHVIIHHTLGVSCKTYKICSIIVKNIQEYSMGSTECFDIKFNFLIGEDGNIYEGTGWFRPGCHTEHYNEHSISIAFIGDFTDSVPNAKALENAKKLINCGIKNEYLEDNYRLYGSKQLNPLTKSPGLALFNEIKTWNKWSEI